MTYIYNRHPSLLFKSNIKMCESLNYPNAQPYCVCWKITVFKVLGILEFLSRKRIQLFHHLDYYTVCV